MDLTERLHVTGRDGSADNAANGSTSAGNERPQCRGQALRLARVTFFGDSSHDAWDLVGAALKF